jgi:glycosyltransferase involved in cell wall biosynthesis
MPDYPINKGKAGVCMRIVFVEEFFSEKMGYSENCLPKALALLGHEVHVIASNLQCYGNLPNYEEIYGGFLGPAAQPVGTKQMDGFLLHRLPHKLWFGRVSVSGLISKITKLNPEIVHVSNCLSISAMKLALLSVLFKYKLFTGCHQSLCITQPYLHQKGLSLNKVIYFITRSIPGWIIGLFINKCVAVTPDCAFVAHKYYKIKNDKITVISLGVDTNLFTPVDDESKQQQRRKIRTSFNINDNDIVCVYTGRLTKVKGPVILAQAIVRLQQQGLSYKAIFIGDGEEKSELVKHPGCFVIPFIPYYDLPQYYQAADIAVWPKQVTISMLDAAACGIPLVVSDLMGEPDRVKGSGEFYKDGDVADLVNVLKRLGNVKIREELGANGRLNMLMRFSWINLAKDFLSNYQYSSSLNKKGDKIV